MPLISDKEQDATWRQSKETASVEWASPPDVLAAAIKTMGGIELDPASSDRANEHVNADRYFTEHDGFDAMDAQWTGSVWLNPPYGQVKRGVSRAGKWGNKLWKEYSSGRVVQACLYVKAAVGYVWFDDLLHKADAACFLWGLPKHQNLADGRYGSAKLGRCVLYFGPMVPNFHNAFRHLGWFKCP